MITRKLFTSSIFSCKPGTKLRNLSADRNCQPILNVLKQVLNNTNGVRGKLLEISSGTGQHAAYFAQHFPNICFYPTEFNQSMIGSIRAFLMDVHTNNIREPIIVDVRKPHTQWDQRLYDENGCEEFDYILNINMIHITAFECTEALFRNAGNLLKNDGLLITYGPYAVNGVLVPESNINFDNYLRSQNPDWGVRDIADLQNIAANYQIVFEKSFDMPANNKICIWRKSNG